MTEKSLLEKLKETDDLEEMFELLNEAYPNPPITDHQVIYGRSAPATPTERTPDGSDTHP